MKENVMFMETERACAPEQAQWSVAYRMFKHLEAQLSGDNDFSL
jgi:hypothetical protein